MTGCNVRTNSIDKLIEKGAVDSSMTITDTKLFDELNNKYSDYARSEYGVKNEGLLFTKGSKEVPRLGASVYNREDTKTVLKAVPNNEMFTELQVNHDSKSGQTFQLEGMPASKASKETLDLLQTASKKMGISIEVLADYAKRTGLNTKGVAGVADLMRGVIAIAQGKENVATTEELVHIATAILEQTDPQVITSMISKIDRFKIYKKTLDTYGKREEYQLPNGKPDIRKIKKEAVDKLIAELIVYNNEGSTEFPELMEEENRSLVRTWWDTILDFVRGIYGKSNIDIFQTVSEKVATGEVGGTVEDIEI